MDIITDEDHGLIEQARADLAAIAERLGDAQARCARWLDPDDRRTTDALEAQHNIRHAERALAQALGCLEGINAR